MASLTRAAKPPRPEGTYTVRCYLLLGGGARGATRLDGPYNLFGMAASGENLALSADGRCELCGRRVGENRLTRHHLLPRSRARKMKRRRESRQELKRRNPHRTVALCAPCHRNVHVSIGNAELGQGVCGQ